MAKAIVVKLSIISLDSTGTHLTCQYELYEKANGYLAGNLPAIAIGMTDTLTNVALGTAVAMAANSEWGTSWLSTDVLLLNGAIFL
jgi:hypothetical protein